MTKFADANVPRPLGIDGIDHYVSHKGTKDTKKFTAVETLRELCAFVREKTPTFVIPSQNFR